MKRFIYILLMFFIAVFYTHAQQPEKQNTPDEQIIVNKKFDEQGNLLEYDSTYIQKWSTDTTFHFGFPGDSLSFQYNFPGIERFMNEFRSDSVFGKYFPQHLPFSFGFRFSPFEDKNSDPNHFPFSDSLFSAPFPFNFDSLFFDFGFGPDKKLPPEFNNRFFEDFEQRLNQHFHRFRDENFDFPGFKNETHQKEWEELMKKHRREMEELEKKWQKEDSAGQNQ